MKDLRDRSTRRCSNNSARRKSPSDKMSTAAAAPDPFSKEVLVGPKDVLCIRALTRGPSVLQLGSAGLFELPDAGGACGDRLGEVGGVD